MRRGDKLGPYDEHPIFRPYQDLLALKTQALDSVQAANTESEWIDCEGKFVVLLAPEFSASNVTARIRAILEDEDGYRTYNEEIRLRNIGQQTGTRETGYYHGKGEQFDCLGAKRYKILMTEEPTNGGFLSMFSGEV
jgi:hypothetical protein